MAVLKADVCVVGSGFGGGVAALRFAEAGRSVIVLEAGNRWDGRAGSKQFQQKLGDFRYWLDLFKVTVGFDAATGGASLVGNGRGLGGGSLVYSMVSLRAPSFAFEDPAWPDGVDRSALDPYYSKAEEQLGVVQMQWTGTPGLDDWKVVSKRDGAFARACHNVGVSCDPVPLAVNPNCGNLGWCTAGCLRRAKNSVDYRYLQPAEDLGADLRTCAEATGIEPGAEGYRWRVHYLQRAEKVGGPPAVTRHSVLADSVVLAAGAIHSPALLMKSCRNLPGGISDQVGRNLSRGGDMILFGLLPDDLGDLDDLEMPPGKIIGVCSFEHMFTPPPGFGSDWQRFALQPMMVLPVISSALAADPDGQTCNGDMRAFGTGVKHIMRRWGRRLLHVGVIGIDGMDGEISLAGGVPRVHFKRNDTTRRLWAAAKAGFRNIIENGAGGTVLPTWDEMRPDGFTIHPLGSCRMADTPEIGGVAHDCAVYKANGGVHEGLYVMDTSVFSAPIGVNTSLTAAAVAERACDLILA